MTMMSYIDYKSMVEIGCVPLIISAFALAFPILLQTASRIDEKYNSTRLIRVFYKERISVIFIASIILSLSSIVIWFLKLPRIVDLGEWCNYLIDNSAFIFVLSNTIFLVIILFQFIKLIKIYFDPLKLSEHLEKKYDKEKK